MSLEKNHNKSCVGPAILLFLVSLFPTINSLSSCSLHPAPHSLPPFPTEKFYFSCLLLLSPLLLLFLSMFSFTAAASRTFQRIHLHATSFADSLREFQAVVISVNYRLIPEHPYPARYDDGFDVLQFIDRNGNVLPEIADLSKCFLAGDSAGANLAHNVAVRICRSKFRNVRVIGQISIRPFFGGEERTESEIRLVNAPLVSMERTDWIWKVLSPDGSNRDHEAVNVSGPNAVDITGMD